MSSTYYHHFSQHHQPAPMPASAAHPHHSGRGRRGAPRLSVSQNSQRQYRGVKSLKDLSAEPVSMSNFRTQFEASRSFDLEDDMEFCPKLLTETDLVSISSASSDRSSLSSNSPNASPTQHPQQVASFALNSASPAFVPPAYQAHQSSMKLHQPAATRTRNAIPIINPANGLTMSSPPSSVSPARMHQPLRSGRW